MFNLYMFILVFVTCTSANHYQRSLITEYNPVQIRRFEFAIHVSIFSEFLPFEMEKEKVSVLFSVISNDCHYDSILCTSLY